MFCTIRRKLADFSCSKYNQIFYSHFCTWKVLSKDCSFCPDPSTNMATIGNSCFWLSDFKKSSPLKLLGQMYRNLVGSIYSRSSLKITYDDVRLISRCFRWSVHHYLPCFDSFGKAVLEETIFLEINQSATRIVCGSHVC
jgi:hypothetical protein